jgi:threonine/homoserine/homoserine lactone efflux protein
VEQAFNYVFDFKQLGLFYIFWLATKAFFATEHTENTDRHERFFKERADGQRVRSLLEGVALL